MNLSQLEVLIAIVDTGSLLEAAEVVSLTPSAVSYSLSRLEAELGVTLLERGRQGVAQTSIGEEVVLHARSILAQVEIIRQKTAREQGFTSGKLRFGTAPSISARLLTGILRSFQQKYPDIDIVVFEGSPLELIDWLNTGVIDVATVPGRDGYSWTAPLVQTEIRLIAPEQHPLAALAEIPVEKLIHETLVGPKAEYGLLTQLLRRSDMMLPPLRYAVSTQSTVMAMVRENMGVALMLDILLESEPEGMIVRPLLPRLFLDIYLAAHIQSPVTAAFMSGASDWAREHHFLPENT